MPDTKQNH